MAKKLDSPKSLAKMARAIYAAVADQGFELSPPQSLYVAMKAAQAVEKENEK